MGATTRFLGVTAAAAAFLAAACGGSQEADDTQAPATTTPSEVPSEPSAPATTDEPGSEPVGSASLVARTEAELEVHSAPDAEPDHILPATTGFGSPRALLVLQEQGDWLEVSLPERPNGSTGWVRRDAVELREIATEIEVDLAARTLTLKDGDDVLTSTPVAVGTPENPTPTGDFYVVDKLVTDEPGGAYGPYALGLSAYSETLTEFGGGDGQVGIHGTNDPSSIGQPVSHGCVRVPNEVVELLNATVNLGTPVTIT